MGSFWGKGNFLKKVPLSPSPSLLKNFSRKHEIGMDGSTPSTPIPCALSRKDCIG